MSIWNLIAGAGSAAGGYMMADDIQAMGDQAASQMGELGAQLQQDSAFKGYGVQTGLGTTTVNPDGSTNLGVGVNQGMQNAAAANYGSASGNYGTAANMLQGGVNPWQQQGYDTTAAAMNRGFNSGMGAQHAAMQGLSGQQAGMLGASQQAMQNAMMDTGAREQDIYNRTMAMQQPGLDAQRASQQAREYAMGRGGVRGSQFGGTAEDAATARAQAQAQNQASFQAMGQAQNEMMNQANMANQFGQQGMSAAGMQSGIGNTMAGMGSQQMRDRMAKGAQLGGMGNTYAAQQAQNAGLLAQIAGGQGQLGNTLTGNSYLDMQHQLQAAQLGGQNADRAQTGQLTGAGYAGQLGSAGIQSQVNAATAASNLYGQMFGAGMNAIGGITQTPGDIWESIFG